MSLRPGVTIDIWDGGELSLVLFLTEEKGRLRVLTRKGREMRITRTRIAIIGDHVVDLGGDRARQTARLGEREDDLAARAETVDLRALWEILTDEGGEYDLEDLAELACAARDPTSCSVVLRRLIHDGLYFVRKKLTFVPRTREDLGETIRRRAAQEERARQRVEFVAAARGRLAGADPVPGWPDGAKRFLGALRDLAIRGADSERLKEATSLLGELGRDGRGDPSLTAFDVLHRLGEFQRDENLLLLKYDVQREFAPEVEAEARRLAAAGVAEEPHRRDLTALACFAVDDAETTEVDDALSFESLGDGRFRVGVHIADPGPYVPHGGLLDQAARDRATTFYLPEERILMLPSTLSEGLASLVAGEVRTALSFLFDLDDEGTVHAREIAESMIRVDRRLTYEQVDLLIRLGGGAPRLEEPLDDFAVEPVADAERGSLPGGLPGDLADAMARAARIMRARLEQRAARGALILKGPDVEVKVFDGEVRLRRFEPWTAAWTLVSEAMVMANECAARTLADARVPTIYRRQAPPDKVIDVPRRYDPASAAQARRLIKPTQLSLTPGPHSGLAVDPYVQCTSPLRRYQDLVCHRQLRAVLDGLPPPLDAETLWQVAAGVDEAEKAAREIERGNREYWLLRHIESMPSDRIFEGTITRPEERRTLLELDEFAYVTQVSPRPGHRPGRKLRVVVNAVAPRARRLLMREVGRD